MSPAASQLREMSNSPEASSGKKSSHRKKNPNDIISKYNDFKKKKNKALGNNYSN